MGGQARVKVNELGEVTVEEIFGATDIPWIRRSRTFTVTPLTIPSGASADVNIVYNATDGSPGYSSYFTTPTTDTVHLVLEGVYEIMGEFAFDNKTFTEDIHFFVSDELNFATKLPTVNQVAGQAAYVSFYWRHRWEAGTDLLITIAQSNASDQSLEEGYFEVHYVGSYSGTDPSSSNPDQ